MENNKEKCVQMPPIPPHRMPWLVFEHINIGHTFSTAYLDNKSSYFLKNTPELLDKTIIGSQFGWLILYDFGQDDDDCCSISLWNPVTSKHITLPSLYHFIDTPRPEKCLLTSPPLEDDCYLMYFVVGHVFACRWDHNTWLSERLEIEGDRAFVQKADVLNGTVYCLATPDDDTSGDLTRLISIQVVGGSGSDSFSLAIRYLSISLPNGFFSRVLGSCFTFMVESCGRIYIAQVGIRCFNWTHDVKLWELDLEHQITVPVKSLGDRAFFLSYLASTWCHTTTADFEYGSRNCLYIFDLDVTHDAVICYSLDDCSSTYLPCPRLQDPCSPNAFWVMPPLPRPAGGRNECKQDDINRGSVASKSCIVDCTREAHEALQWNSTQPDYMTMLPQDLIQLLSKKIHLFDYWNFRCTSKIIQSATPTPGWRTHHLFPLFLVFDNDAGSCRLMDPCRYDSRPCHLQLSQQYFGIEFSKDGWLVVFDGETLKFFNPFTRVSANLPPLNQIFETIGFSTNPTCSNCLTVTIYRDWDKNTVFNCHRSGDKEWTTRRFDITQNIDFHPSRTSPVYHSGAFWFLDDLGFLGVLEWVDEDITWTIYDQPLAQTRKFHSCYLIKHGHELVAVVIGNVGRYVKVYAFNFRRKAWVGVHSLGNHVLFISPYSSLSIPTTDTKMNDRIYVPCTKGERIVFYSLKTQKYHVDHGHDYARTDFFFVKNPSRCCWI